MVHLPCLDTRTAILTRFTATQFQREDYEFLKMFAETPPPAEPPPYGVPPVSEQEIMQVLAAVIVGRMLLIIGLCTLGGWMLAGGTGAMIGALAGLVAALLN